MNMYLYFVVVHNYRTYWVLTKSFYRGTVSTLSQCKIHHKVKGPHMIASVIILLSIQCRESEQIIKLINYHTKGNVRQWEHMFSVIGTLSSIIGATEYF